MSMYVIISLGSFLFFFTFGVTLFMCPIILFSMRNKDNDKVKFGYSLLFLKGNILSKEGFQVRSYIRRVLIFSGIMSLIFMTLFEVLYT